MMRRDGMWNREDYIDVALRYTLLYLIEISWSFRDVCVKVLRHLCVKTEVRETFV